MAQSLLPARDAQRTATDGTASGRDGVQDEGRSTCPLCGLAAEEERTVYTGRRKP